MIDRSMRSAVIAGLVSSCVFLVIIEPFLRVIGRVFLLMGGRATHSLVDHLFANAAASGLAEPSTMLLSAVFGVGSGLLIGMYWFARKAMSSRAGPTRVVDWAFQGAVIAIPLMAFYQASTVSFEHGMIVGFTQRLAAIAPYTSDEQEKILRSAWARMRTKADYDVIRASTDSIARAARITLP